MATLTGRVLMPGDPGWNQARANFDRRFDVQARAVVFCQVAEDVVNALLWALQNDVPFRVRSGRHSYEGYSLVDNGLVIDVSELDTVTVDRVAGTATIGAGIDMLHVTEALAEVGVTIPLATGPTVGLAGLTLGGGFGLTSRCFGLTCDNLKGIEMVDARGRLLHVTDAEYPDLFWALRGGGGGNFGIVTRFTFQVHPVDLVSAFIVQWPWPNFDAVVAAWQEWAPNAEDGVASVLRLGTDRSIKLYGQFTASASELARIAAILQPMLSTGTPIQVTLQTVPYIVAARSFFGEGAERVDPQMPKWTVLVHSDQQIYKSTSAVATQPFPSEAIATLRQQLEQCPPLSVPPSQPSMVQLLAGGGAPGRIPADATAVVHRNAKFFVQYDGYWTTAEEGAPTLNWVANMRRAMLSYASGAYVNYVDSMLQDPLRDYYGTNLERLIEVKRNYDPENVFNFPQSIPVEVPVPVA